ncbi:MAG: phosphatase PAP2 family protein [Clostridia bacterium]|nr:phosphatase PAP2 family protein [Clostridia bacterium]
MPDWKNFRLSKLNTPEYKHLLLLLYWPVYLAVFQALEHWTDREYTILHSFIDDYIPFNEYFVVPYLFWFVYMFSMSVYAAFFDRDCFVYYMKLIIITSTTACIAYLVYPTALELRPSVFPRDNIFTDITKMIYSFDTSTNVCPSMHVTGSVATMLASFKAKHMNKSWKLTSAICAVLICASTVFMKQHSIIDVFWALVVCVAAEGIVRISDSKLTKNYSRIITQDIDTSNNIQ